MSYSACVVEIVENAMCLHVDTGSEYCMHAHFKLNNTTTTQLTAICRHIPAQLPKFDQTTGHVLSPYGTASAHASAHADPG